MSETDQNKEDEVLKRMLATKPKPHKGSAPAGEQDAKKSKALGRTKSR